MKPRLKALEAKGGPGRRDPDRGSGGPALERAKTDKEAHGEFENECQGYRGAQDTFLCGTLEGVEGILQRTFIDTYAKVVFAKLHDRKTPLTAAHLTRAGGAMARRRGGPS